MTTGTPRPTGVPASACFKSEAPRLGRGRTDDPWAPYSTLGRGSVTRGAPSKALPGRRREREPPTYRNLASGYDDDHD